MLQVPGQMNVAVKQQDANFAHPADVTIQAPDGIVIFRAGGLSKLEHGAFLIAAGMGEDFDAHLACQRAAAVLHACNNPSASNGRPHITPEK